MGVHRPLAPVGQLIDGFILVATTVILDTQTSGATVEVDGKPIGTTPVTVTTLPPGTTQQVVFKKAGYREQSANVNVPVKTPSAFVSTRSLVKTLTSRGKYAELPNCRKTKAREKTIPVSAIMPAAMADRKGTWTAGFR